MGMYNFTDYCKKVKQSTTLLDLRLAFEFGKYPEGRFFVAAEVSIYDEGFWSFKFI